MTFTIVRRHTGVQVYNGIYLERRYAVPAAGTRYMNCIHTGSSYNCLTYASKSSKALNSSPILESAISFMNECSREVIDRIKYHKRGNIQGVSYGKCDYEVWLHVITLLSC